MRETIFVWDSVNDCVMSELDGSGAVQVTYTNEPQQYGGVISQRRGTTTSTYHADALGSTRALTDSSGNVTDTYLNDAWGNSVTSTGTTVNPFRWVGKYGYYTDNSTGQVYVRARMYQPTLAQWTVVTHRKLASPLSRFDEPASPIKRNAPYPVTCAGMYWWKFSRGNDDSFASAPWNENFQSAVICVELDIESSCRWPAGIGRNPDNDQMYWCCEGDVKHKLRYRAVQTGHVYDIPPFISSGTALAFHREAYWADASITDGGCSPNSSRLQLTEKNPFKPLSNEPWGQGSTLTAATECSSYCHRYSPQISLKIFRRTTSWYDRWQLLQNIRTGSIRTDCASKPKPSGCGIEHIQNSPQHRADDMIRLIDVSPSVGFVGPLQQPHLPQPVWPQK